MAFITVDQLSLRGNIYDRIFVWLGQIILKQESFNIIGACMEVHRILGPGLKEIVYKDALELELK